MWRHYLSAIATLVQMNSTPFFTVCRLKGGVAIINPMVRIPSPASAAKVMTSRSICINHAVDEAGLKEGSQASSTGRRLMQPFGRILSRPARCHFREALQT